jgi:hypothetical protein
MEYDIKGADAGAASEPGLDRRYIIKACCWLDSSHKQE